MTGYIEMLVTPDTIFTLRKTSIPTRCPNLFRRQMLPLDHRVLKIRSGPVEFDIKTTYPSITR